MDMKRTNEIVNSLGVINVNYKKAPVWIENVVEASNQAMVRDLETDEKFTVNVSELEEG